MKEEFLKESIFYILDFVEEGIHIIDKNGKIVYYNKFAQELDDIDREKAIGRHILEVYPSLSYNTSTLLKVIKTGEPIFNVEQTFINYKGKKITTINSSIPIILDGKVEGALEISKDITQVRKLSEKIVDLQKELYKEENGKQKKNKGTSYYTFVDIVGQSQVMLKLKSLALKAALTSSPVLIYGETGTGKELFVQSIHSASLRRNKPFIAQNCAALPSNLLEGILFGTVKGGFTGAEDRPGLFELANGGTLFLDEINSMPLDLQPKLLRVLQDGTVRRVGATKTINVDVRIIAATNVDPEKAIANNLLRKDLYYRLNVIYLKIPELKNRKEDIPILTDYFIKKYNRKLNRSVKCVSKEVMNTFLRYPWEGNVRELEHVIEGVMTMYDTDKITLKHLPQRFEMFKENYLNLSKERKSLKVLVEQTEKNAIYQALKETNFNITKTAKVLNIPRQTLQYKIKKYNLS